jgi:hypothetical protein
MASLQTSNASTLMIEGKGLGSGLQFSKSRRSTIIRSAASNAVAAGKVAATTVKIRSAEMRNIVTNMASDGLSIMAHDSAVTSSVSISAIETAASQITAASEYVSERATVAIQAVVRETSIVTNASVKLASQSSQAIAAVVSNNLKRQVHQYVVHLI